MDDATKFIRIFGDHRQPATSWGSFHIRDANLIADLKARVSGLAARDNRARNSGWLIDFSPTRTDDLTERSLFDVTLTSATEGERRISFRVGREWVEMGDGVMESSVRNDSRNIDKALKIAFGRVVPHRPSVRVDRVPVGSAGA